MARRNRFIDQATLQALVRFGPELSGLKALQRQALQTYQTTTRSARGAASFISQTADQERPQARHDWQAAGLAAARAAHATLGANQPAPSAGNSAVQNAILGEQAGIRSRIAESKANELQDLRRVKVQAGQGAAWAQTSARNDLVSTLRDVFDRQQSLASEKGAYIASTAQDLSQTAAERAQQMAIAQGRNTQSERNSLRSAGIDPNTGKPFPGGKLDPKARARKGKGGSRATATQIGTAQDEVQRLMPLIRRQKQRGRSRQDVAQVLMQGIEAQPVYVTGPNGTQHRALNPDGTPKMTGGITPTKSQLLLSAALDIAYGGYVSEQTRRKLHRRGIYLTDLGLLSRAEYLKIRHKGVTERGINSGVIAGPPAPR